MLLFKIWRYTVIRLMKLFGNLLKPLFYLHLMLFPKKRFVVPRLAAPLVKAKNAQAPSIVWFTNYTDRVTLAVYVNYLWNRLLAYRCEVRLSLDDECAEFIQTHFSGAIFEAYSKLQIGAAKADFWRILAIYQHGGMYADMDTALCWPVHRLMAIANPELILRGSDGRLTNYCFAAQEAGNPLLHTIAMQILRNIQENTLKSVYDMTGPTVFEHLADKPEVNIMDSRWVARQGLLTSKKLQYPDKLRGYWVQDQQEKSILK